MEEYNQIIQLIALSMGVAWASGINLYAAILTLGIAGATSNIELPQDLQYLSSKLCFSFLNSAIAISACSLVGGLPCH